MAILNRANEQQQSEWQEVPEGLWRWVVGKPELKVPDKYGYRVKFPLELHPTEQERLKTEYDAPPEGIQQSRRASYSVGLSLGYVQRDGQYKSTKLIDFLTACMGAANTKKFRDWVAAGGGPPRPEDKDDQRAELALIEEWLTWWEGLEVYGTVSHAAGTDDPGRVFARFAGPMAVGSLPGHKDADYQAHGRGKLRAIIVQAHPELAEQRTNTSEATRVLDDAGMPITDKPAQQFTAEGKPAKPTYEEVFGDEEKGTAFADMPKEPAATGSRDLPW